MRIAQYTAIFGGYDTILPPRVVNDDIDYILYTDAESAPEPWQIRRLDCPNDWRPRKKQRYVKILSHKFLGDYDVTLWHGGNISTVYKTRWPLQFVASSYLALYTHPHRDCIYEEVAACKRIGKGNRHKLIAQAEHYRKQGHPKHWGLWAAWFMVRKPCERLGIFEREWWGQVEAHSLRDQVSFPYVLRGLGVKPTTIPGSLLTDPEFVYRLHKKVA